MRLHASRAKVGHCVDHSRAIYDQMEVACERSGRFPLSGVNSGIAIHAFAVDPTCRLVGYGDIPGFLAQRRPSKVEIEVEVVYLRQNELLYVRVGRIGFKILFQRVAEMGQSIGLMRVLR